MSVSGDLRKLAPKGEAIGGSLLRIGLANFSTEQLGAIFCIVFGGILAPNEFKVALARLTESTEDQPKHAHTQAKGRNKDVR